MRTNIGYKAYKLGGAKNININDLRGRLHELDPGTVGYRGYLATRVLRENGFEAYNVLGGIESVNRFLKQN